MISSGHVKSPQKVEIHVRHSYPCIEIYCGGVYVRRNDTYRAYFFDVQRTDSKRDNRSSEKPKKKTPPKCGNLSHIKTKTMPANNNNDNKITNSTR